MDSGAISPQAYWIRLWVEVRAFHDFGTVHLNPLRQLTDLSGNQRKGRSIQ